MLNILTNSRCLSQPLHPNQKWIETTLHGFYHAARVSHKALFARAREPQRCLQVAILLCSIGAFSASCRTLVDGCLVPFARLRLFLFCPSIPSAGPTALYMLCVPNVSKLLTNLLYFFPTPVHLVCQV